MFPGSANERRTASAGNTPVRVATPSYERDCNVYFSKSSRFPHSTPAMVPANGQPCTLAEQIDHEALAYRSRGDSIGNFMADHLDRLAQLVRWTDASTPEDHDSRMEVWDGEISAVHTIAVTKTAFPPHVASTDFGTDSPWTDFPSLSHTIPVGTNPTGLSSGDLTMLTMTEARERFEARFPEFQNKAKAYFHEYKPEAKDEAVANSLFLTWHHFVSWSRTARPTMPC